MTHICISIKCEASWRNFVKGILFALRNKYQKVCISASGHNGVWFSSLEMLWPSRYLLQNRDMYKEWLQFAGNQGPNTGQEARVITRHGTTDWFKMGKGVYQSCILSPCLFNLNAEYIMQNARLDEAQAGIKTARRNINNLRYADDTTFTAEGEEELKSLLKKVKEESEKSGLKLSIKKN